MSERNERGCFHTDSESCYKAGCPTTLSDAEQKAKRIRDAKQRDQGYAMAAQATAERQQRIDLEQEARPRTFAAMTRAEKLRSTRKVEKRVLKQRQRAHETQRLDRQEAIWDAADKIREEAQAKAEGDDVAAADDFESLTPEVVLADTEKLPALWKRDDGETLLYAQRVNGLYGEPSVGKSWLALMVALSAIKKGGNVLWLDFEDKPNTLARRAALLGGLQHVTDRSKFRFGIPELSESETALESALTWLKEGNEYSAVIIDSCESAGAPSDGQPIGDFFDKYVQRWKEAEVAVLLLDHIPKRKVDRPRGPIGSTHKLSRLDGAALVVSGLPWSKTTGGKLKLVTDKDRHGDLPAPTGKTATLVVGEYQTVNGEKTFAYHISADGEETEQTLDDASLDLLVMMRLEEGGVNKRGLRGLLPGVGASRVDRAASQLIDSNYLEMTREGHSHVYTATQEGKAIIDAMNEGH